jgi:hypothetical protein
MSFVVAVGGSGAAAGRAPAKTKLSIQLWPDGVFGYVSSPNAARCARGRKIEVFATGRTRSRLRRLAVVTATRNQLGYEWLARTPSGETLDAVAPATRGCAAARSSGTVARGFTALPDCGAERAPECVVVINLAAGAGGGKECTTFTESSDFCLGQTDRANPGWSVSHGVGARFEWESGFPRPLKYTATNDGDRTGFIAGTVSCGACADFKVSDACNYVSPHPALHYFTRNDPGAKPGTPGGPLYLNFDARSGVNRTHVIIWGVLESTFTARSCSA